LFLPVATIVQPDITANGNPTTSINAAAIYVASTMALVLIEQASSKVFISGNADVAGHDHAISATDNGWHRAEGQDISPTPLAYPTKHHTGARSGMHAI